MSCRFILPNCKIKFGAAVCEILATLFPYVLDRFATSILPPKELKPLPELGMTFHSLCHADSSCQIAKSSLEPKCAKYWRPCFPMYWTDLPRPFYQLRSWNRYLTSVWPFTPYVMQIHPAKLQKQVWSRSVRNIGNLVFLCTGQICHVHFTS